MKISKCYQSDVCPPRLLVDKHSSAHHRVEYTQFLFSVHVLVTMLLQGSTFLLSVFLLSLQICCRYIKCQVPDMPFKEYFFLSFLFHSLSCLHLYKALCPTECSLKPSGLGLKQFLTNSGRKQEKKSQNLMVTMLWLLIVLKQNSGLLAKLSPVFSQ